MKRYIFPFFSSLLFVTIELTNLISGEINDCFQFSQGGISLCVYFGAHQCGPWGVEDLVCIYFCGWCRSKTGYIQRILPSSLSIDNKGYVWHKTIVDSKCFRPIPTVVHFDGNYNMTRSEIEGGHYIGKEEYESLEVSQTTEGDNLDG